MHERRAGTEPASWDDVRVFLALCRARTLGEAGHALGVDGSTMSRRLDALEGGLGTTLFERGRGGIAATEAALQLRPLAEEMEHVMARFAGTVENFERDVSGVVRLACPGDAAEIFVAPLLPALLRRHPRLCIDVTSGESVVDMARREADLALRTARPTSGDLVVTRLFPVRWRVAATPVLAESVGMLRAWSDVPWVGCSTQFSDTTPARWFEAALGRLEPVARADSLTMQLACVRAGLGVALFPERSIEASGLRPLKLSRRLRESAPPWPEDDLFLVSHRSLRSVPRVRAVWEFLLEQGLSG